MPRRWLAAGAVVVAGVAAFIITFRPDGGGEQPSAADRLPLAEAGVEGSVVRLLRAAEGDVDAERLDALVTRYRDGEPLAAIAGEVVSGREFTETYGRLDDTELVDRLYDD